MDLDSLILQLLEATPIADQGDLLAQLEAKGHELTQSTLSRRLKRLAVHKVQGRYVRSEDAARRLPAATVQAVPPNLLVLRTALVLPRLWGSPWMLTLRRDRWEPWRGTTRFL